jgi:hypothetical protein
MKLKLILTAGSLFVCGLLSADSPVCTTGTLAQYIALGAKGCTFDGDVFANFSYTGNAGNGASAITADQIVVTPLVAIPATAIFNFSAPWRVGQDQTQSAEIKYTIVPPAGGALPPQLRLTLGAAQVGGIIGSVTVNEPTNVGLLSVFEQCAEVCRANLNALHNFAPVSVVLVTLHVMLSGGTGGALLNQFVTAFDRCPLCV